MRFLSFILFLVSGYLTGWCHRSKAMWCALLCLGLPVLCCSCFVGGGVACSKVRKMCWCYDLELPSNYTALSGELSATLSDFIWEPGAYLELLQLQPTPLSSNHTKFIRNSSWLWSSLSTVDIPSSSSSERTTISFPCGVIVSGGQYGVRVAGIRDPQNVLNRRGKFIALTSDPNELNIVGLDVRWPECSISTAPRHIETYPEVQVTALVQFPAVSCSPANASALTESWLDLIACGPSLIGCSNTNRSHGQIIYSEQIRGYPRRREVVLRCELFGIAGHYTLGLRPSLYSNRVIPCHNQDAYIKAVWSDQYIFNVRARSIFPCDVHGGGVPVLFQYPKCILQGDSVRLYSHHRADVSSLAAPVKSEYVAEQHVQKGSHGLKFDCELFSERFIEYCFVYVSRAITDAMSNVRVDCVPSLPVSESDSGGWSEWSEWTACTTTCGGGTRNRFRICDSPPPRYGAKFCQGEAVQTEKCGNSDWECDISGVTRQGEGSSEGKDSGEVSNVCRCGCVLHLGAAKPKRLLSASSHSCPGRALWLIQADDDHVIRLDMEYFRFPCRSQWLKIRDGDSTEATLLGEFSLSHQSPSSLTSSSQYLLLDFYSDEFLTAGHECRGEFQARAQQTSRNLSSIAGAKSFSISSILQNVEAAPNATGLGVVHGVVALFLTVLFLMTGCLGIQYVHRYRKYQLAAATEDQDSLTAGSQGSLVPVRSRATSNSTLLSEVISMRRFAPMKCRHTRLRELDVEVDETADESSDCQRDDATEELPKSVGSQQTLKAANSDDSSATPTPSPEAVRRPSAYALTIPTSSPPPDEPGNTSSLDSTTSRGSSIARLLLQRRQSLSSSSTRSAYTHQPGCDSNSSSLQSNPKAKKERRNRERLLAGSEFSLTGEADLEMDYYDYNVHNAAAVPESYIGMDPAYLVWIPPASPVSWELEDQSDSAENSPERERLRVIDGKGEDTSVMFIKDSVPNVNNRVQTQALVHTGGRSKKVQEDRRKTLCEEKETAVEKSPSGETVNYRVIDDIKFADDDEDEMKINSSAV